MYGTCKGTPIDEDMTGMVAKATRFIGCSYGSSIANLSDMRVAVWARKMVKRKNVLYTKVKVNLHKPKQPTTHSTVPNHNYASSLMQNVENNKMQ